MRGSPIKAPASFDSEAEKPVPGGCADMEEPRELEGKYHSESGDSRVSKDPRLATQLPASGQCSIGLKIDKQINGIDPEINPHR